MNARDDQNLGAEAVRAGHEIDKVALASWMVANVPALGGPLAVAQFKGGQSNPTYRLTRPSAAYVLRRKPPGQLLKGAHAIEREACVMQALGTTGFPVPQVHAVCADDTVLGPHST